MTYLFRPMTALPLRTTRVNNLFNLPPTLRSRAFHATTRRPFYNETVHFTHTVLVTIHTVSCTTWGLTIPLVALLVRGAFTLPIALRSRRAAQKQIEMLPLMQAWSHAIETEAQKEVGVRGPGEVRRYVRKAVRKKRKEVYKRNRISLWSSLGGLVPIPIFLAVIETLRLMVGVKQGFLGLVTTYWRGNAVEGESGAVITGGGLTSIPPIPIEPSMATEGILWFPDLLAADPQLLLPFMFSGALLLNTYASGKLLSSASTDSEGHKVQRVLTRGSGIFALAIGPLLLGFPSALVLYLFSSSVFNFLQTLVLAWWIPLPKAHVPALPRRPWRSGFGVKRQDIEKA